MTAPKPTFTLPAGFTIGAPASADWGSSYYKGMKVNGRNEISATKVRYGLNDRQGNASNQYVDVSNVDDATILAALEANWESVAHQIWELQEAAATSTSPAMKAMLGDPEYEALVVSQPADTNGNKLFVSLYASASAELQAKIFATPIGKQMVSTGQLNTDGTIADAWKDQVTVFGASDEATTDAQGGTVTDLPAGGTTTAGPVGGTGTAGAPGAPVAQSDTQVAPVAPDTPRPGNQPRPPAPPAPEGIIEGSAQHVEALIKNLRGELDRIGKQFGRGVTTGAHSLLTGLETLWKKV